MVEDLGLYNANTSEHPNTQSKQACEMGKQSKSEQSLKHAVEQSDTRPLTKMRPMD